MVKYKISWSVEARLDLIDILKFYIERNLSNTYSIKLNAKINKRIKALIRNPFLGKPTEYESVRALVTADYEIIYEIIKQDIIVVMIWDCRRNPEKKIIDKRLKK